MPILKSGYSPKNPLFRNKHFASIFPTQFRSVHLEDPLTRQRLTTPDGDFIDLDLSEKNHKRVALLLHGFEGSSTRPYMLGIARHLQDEGWDIVAMNHRGCSGEPNKVPRAYHAGEYTDMAFVIDHIISTRNYHSVALIGFSLGGNILLNYLAKQRDIPDQILAGVAISVPIDLRTAVYELMKPSNWIYNRDFYRKLLRKIKIKQKAYPDLLPYDEILQSRNLDEIDENYTAPYHGFENATDYREKSSSLFVLDRLQRPALLLNAKDDPFLTESCYPYEIADSSEELFLMTPRYGGHCGFWMPGGVYYHEQESGFFLEKYV